MAPIFIYAYKKQPPNDKGKLLRVKNWFEGENEAVFKYYLIPIFSQGTVTLRKDAPTITVSRKGMDAYEFNFRELEEAKIRFTDYRELILESKDGVSFSICYFDKLSMLRFTLKLSSWHGEFPLVLSNK